MRRRKQLSLGVVLSCGLLASGLEEHPRHLTHRVPSMPRPVLKATAQARPSKREEPRGSSMLSMVLQIVNNVAGAGILTLSAGMSAGVGSIPAALLCLMLGVLSGVTFHLIGIACELTGETTFKGLWTATLGASTAWTVDATIALMCLSAAIIYAGILGDTSTQLLNLAGVPAWLNARGMNIAIITVCALTPLSLLEDVSALSFTSMLGCAAVTYTAAFIFTRAIDGSYALPSAAGAAGGHFLSSLSAELRPAFELASRWKLDVRSLVLTSNLGLAYIAHYNAPTFYRALDRRSIGRFGSVCAMAFGTLSLLYMSIMMMGYRTFGDVTAANILLNYAEGDPLAVLGRAATFISILFGFPLATLGLRESINSLFDLPYEGQGMRTMICLVLIALVAISVSDIGLIVGISGALLGAAIVYIFPSLIYGAAVQQRRARTKVKSKKSQLEALDTDGGGRLTGSEVAAAHFRSLDQEYDGHITTVELVTYLLVPLGVFLGILGVWMTLTS